MTNPAEDFEARLTRVLKAGVEELPVGQIVPPFATPHGLAPRSRPRRRTVRRKLAMVGIAVGLGLTGTAAAATIVHLTPLPSPKPIWPAATQSTASLEAMTSVAPPWPLPAPLARTHRSPTPSQPARSSGKTGSWLPARERK